MNGPSGAWLVALALAACGTPDRGPRFRAAGAASPRDGGTLRYSVIGEVRTLDPSVGFDENTNAVIHALFDTLVDFRPDSLEIAPRLAARWEISPDGRTYTFELRPGIAFSDGSPITAAHFKYGLERALTTQDSPFAAYIADIAGAQALKDGKARDCAGIVDSGDRLVITLAQVNPAFLDVLTMAFTGPQRPEHVAAAGDQLRRRPDATGPFVLASWDEGTRLVLRRNAHYHDPSRVHLDGIEVVENVPRDVQFQMFERGELDTAEKLAAPDYLFVMSEPRWQPYVRRSVQMNVFGSRINVRARPFTDRRVRQALNYALDKSHTARLLYGTTVPAHGILPPGMLGRDPSLAPYPHDVARARALLAEAGYPHGFEVEYVTPNDEETEKVVGSLQSDLAEAGIRLRITVMSFATYVTAVGQPDGPALAYTSWSADYPDPANFFEPRFLSRSISKELSTNDSFYENPELDALLDEAHGLVDPARRDLLYRRAERILYDDAPWIWDYHRVAVEVTQPDVRGYEPHPIWLRDYTSVWLDLGPEGARLPERESGAR